jgi:prevent-host-death family protein
MRRIGIRELRQNASEYIRLVKAGETIEVTDRGAPVALLSPLPDEPPKKKTRREELIEQGLLIPGTQNWDDWKPLPSKPGDLPMTEILDELREDRL